MRRFFLILFYICLASPLIFPFPLRAEEKIILATKKEVKLEPFDLKTFPLGSRIMVILKNGSIFKGLLSKKTPQKLKLDLSYEKHGINGSVGLYLSQIASIKRLPHLSPLEAKAARLARQKELEDMRERMAKRKALTAKRREEQKKAQEAAFAREVEQRREREEDALLGLLAEFPPEEGWGADRIERIHQNILLYDVFPSPEEQEFMQKFPLWLEALKILERKTAEAEKEKEAEEAKETEEVRETEETTEAEETKGIGEIEPAP